MKFYLDHGTLKRLNSIIYQRDTHNNDDDADDEKFHFTLPSLTEAQSAMIRISNKGTKSGYGLIANCDIKRGTVILRQNPLIVIPDYVQSQKNTATQWIQQQFDALSSTEQNIYKSLSMNNLPQNSTESKGDQDTLWMISKTNGIPMPERNAKGVFSLISRVNHSCESNVGWVWMNNLEEERLIAHCDIQKGSELLACYVGEEMYQRQNPLKTIWNIDCQFYGEEKELMFKEYKELNDAMPSMGKDPIKGLKTAKKCIEITEKYMNNNPMTLSTHYYDAAQFAMGLQRWSEAAYYLDTSMKEKRIAMGCDVVMDDMFMQKVQMLPEKFRRKFKKYETPGKIEKEVKVVKVAAKKKQNNQQKSNQKKNQKKKQNKKNQQNKRKKQKKRKNRR